jgi:hypothetical protein
MHRMSMTLANSLRRPAARQGDRALNPAAGLQTADHVTTRMALPPSASTLSTESDGLQPDRSRDFFPPVSPSALRFVPHAPLRADRSGLFSQASRNIHGISAWAPINYPPCAYARRRPCHDSHRLSRLC